MHQTLPLLAEKKVTDFDKPFLIPIATAAKVLDGAWFRFPLHMQPVTTKSIQGRLHLDYLRTGFETNKTRQDKNWTKTENRRRTKIKTVRKALSPIQENQIQITAFFKDSTKYCFTTQLRSTNSEERATYVLQSGPCPRSAPCSGPRSPWRPEPGKRTRAKFLEESRPAFDEPHR
jgi:hypothetical protein